MRGMGSIVIGAVGAFALAACTTPISPPPAGPPAFRAAYNDGCAAGYGYAGSPYHATPVTTRPPQGTAAYQAGWVLGFDKCRGSYDRVQDFMHALLGSP